MTRYLIAAALLIVLTGCNFDPEKELAACKATFPGDDDAIAVCFRNAQNGHRVARFFKKGESAQAKSAEQTKN